MKVKFGVASGEACNEVHLERPNISLFRKGAVEVQEYELVLGASTMD